MTAYFHVGTHKTGTTSIQRFLASNRSILKANNILYPDYPDLISVDNGHYAHLDLAKSIVPRRGNRFSQFQIDQMFQSINAFQVSQDVLISSEPFWRVGFNDNDAFDDVFINKKNLLNSYFKKIDSPRFVVTARFRSDFMLSLYSENILQTQNTHTFEQFVRDKWYLFDYEKNLMMWSSLGDLSVLSFEYLKSFPSLGYKFLASVLGYEVPSLSSSPTKKFNESYCIPLLVYKLHLNRQGVSAVDGKQKIQEIYEILKHRESSLMISLRDYSWADSDWWFANYSRKDHVEMLDNFAPPNSTSCFNAIDYNQLESRYLKKKAIDDGTISLIIEYFDYLLKSNPDISSQEISIQNTDFTHEIEQLNHTLTSITSQLLSARDMIKSKEELLCQLQQENKNLQSRQDMLQEEMQITLEQFDLIQDELNHYFSISLDQRKVLSVSKDIQTKLISMLFKLSF